ncbi:MAG: PIG-L family deacetylase [Ferruginibacter sp.]
MFKLISKPGIRLAMHSVKLIVLLLIFSNGYAQTPKSYSSSEILLQLRKLKVLGSVLYVAAHPDDENTRLLGYFANEKLYRTGYLSLTRGDGGQNLIGDEQGVDLGLIRTQELLAARRIDGAEQFFSTAYDFGYSKSPDEALSIWNHDKILADVVWVIRNFKPDIIVCRFPTTGEGGHGHHTASAILAEEAFTAAADPARFPEQLSGNVAVWQAKRIVWNTFNFGSNNTQKEDQFKMDVGGFNPLLGKSYGEIAALSRSQHKSQGFGVPAQRGKTLEYFATIKGEKPVSELMDGVSTVWNRIGLPVIELQIDTILNEFNSMQPAASVKKLVRLYNSIEQSSDFYWKTQKLKELKELIAACSGLYMEATSANHNIVLGDSMKLNISLNNRLGAGISSATVSINGNTRELKLTAANENSTYTETVAVPADKEMLNITQPYWLKEKMNKGSFNVNDRQLIGKPENDPVFCEFIVKIEGKEFSFRKPVQYKFTDPVKGEIYQPVCFVPAVTVTPKTSLFIGNSDKPKQAEIEVTAFRKTAVDMPFMSYNNGQHKNIPASLSDSTVLSTQQKKLFSIEMKPGIATVNVKDKDQLYNQQLRTIAYDHIPQINYFKNAIAEYKLIDVKISGKTIGYIPGAGDKVPEALEQMGYKVTMLSEKDINPANVKQFDAIVTGVRAYNTNEWMSNVYDVLMDYVNGGGVLLVQYNTSNQIGPVKAKIFPYPFSITRNRITDETASVSTLKPEHPFFNIPNKITTADFDGWVQERSVYHAESKDEHFTTLISMKDPNEAAHDGSLLVASHGKGRLIYTGISFFRQLPAGVSGAYRLFANLLAKP